MANKRAKKKPYHDAYHKEGVYALPVKVSTVLDLFVLHNEEVRTIGSLDPQEALCFVRSIAHDGLLKPVLEGIPVIQGAFEWWFILIELSKKKSVKLCLYHSQEEAEEALKNLRVQVA